MDIGNSNLNNIDLVDSETSLHRYVGYRFNCTPDPGAAGCLPQTPKTADPLQISGYTPGYNTSEFLRFCA